MKPMCSSGTLDRAATLEEVYQAMDLATDLLGSITTDQGLLYSPILGFSLPLAPSQEPAHTKGLWIDLSEEDDGAPWFLREPYSGSKG